MLNDSTSTPSPVSQDRDMRHQELFQALRVLSDRILHRMADELVDLPDDQVFGTIESTLRDLGHELATQAHQAGIEAGKKKEATRAPVASARTVRVTPASSATAPRLG
jgi:hypothetical protein